MLFVIGGADALSQISPELEPPRILQSAAYRPDCDGLAFGITAVAGFLVAAIVPAAARQTFTDTAIAGLALHLAGPSWIRIVMAVAIAASAGLIMAAAARSALVGAQVAMTRLVDDGLLPPALRAPHPRFGTPWRMLDLVVAVQFAVVAFSGAHIGWLTRAFGIGIAVSAVLKTLAVIRLRRLQREPRAFRVPGERRASPDANGRSCWRGLPP